MYRPRGRVTLTRACGVNSELAAHVYVWYGSVARRKLRCTVDGGGPPTHAHTKVETCDEVKERVADEAMHVAAGEGDASHGQRVVRR